VLRIRFWIRVNSEIFHFVKIHSERKHNVSGIICRGCAAPMRHTLQKIICSTNFFQSVCRTKSDKRLNSNYHAGIAREKLRFSLLVSAKNVSVFYFFNGVPYIETIKNRTSGNFCYRYNLGNALLFCFHRFIVICFERMRPSSATSAPDLSK